MRRHCYHKSIIIISFWILVSCSNLEVGNLPQPKSTPQLLLTHAETLLSSPDGSWTAYFLGHDLEKIRFSVANFDDTVIWNVSQPHFASPAWFTPYRWSQDNRYLYFNVFVEIDGYVPFYQGGGLQRLDVLNGEVSEILPSGELITVNPIHYRWNFPAFSLSPEDDKLAYITRMDSGIQLVIRNMKTNAENSLDFDQYSDAGSIIWSPEQDYLVLAASKGTNWSNTLGFVEIIEVDTLTPRTVVENKNGVFDPVVWLNNHTILLKERGGNYFYLDTTTEKLSPAPDLRRVPD